MNDCLEPETHDDADRPSTLRALSNTLCLWRLCARQGCRNAGACRGEPRRCLPVNTPLVPEGARAYVAKLFMLRDLHVPFEEAVEDLGKTPEGEAYAAWVEAVAASRRRPRRKLIGEIGVTSATKITMRRSNTLQHDLSA